MHFERTFVRMGNMKVLCLFSYLICQLAIGISFDWEERVFWSAESIVTLPSNDVSLRYHKKLSDICNSETFNHDYWINTKEIKPVTNSWNSARVNESATLNKICLQKNGLPITRKCIFNPEFGAVWEPIKNWSRIKCIGTPSQEIITPELHLLHEDLLKRRTTAPILAQKREEIVSNVLEILQKPKYKFLPADVYHTAQIMHDVFENTTEVEMCEDIVRIFSTIMSVDDSTVRLSAELNSTNIFLRDFEGYMNNLRNKFVPSSRCGSSTHSRRFQNHFETRDFSGVGVYAHITANVSIFYVNPTCANITGIAIYDHKTSNSQVSSKTFYESEGSFFYRFVYSNETVQDLIRENGIQVATFLPEKLWTQLKQKLPKDDQAIVFKIYAHDSLFVSTGNILTCRPSSRILSISIPKFSGRFPEPLPFLVRNKYFKATGQLPSNGTGCGYWNYEKWLYDDIETTLNEKANGAVVLCTTRHLTQFSFLLGGQYKQQNIGDDILITPLHEKALDIISMVGCTLSLLGLLGIWITATLFKTWRSLSSTKVLLNLCLVLTLQMILFLFVNTDEVSEKLIQDKLYKECIALGALLQYTILVLFTWMLLIAILQFQRYVTIIGIQRPKHYILKAAIAAWGLPIIPTLIVVFTDPKGFIPDRYELETNIGICYPSGLGLIYGIVLPITVICLANLTIFIYVFYSISHSLNQSLQRHEKTMVMKQIRLSILLFFLLGLCWIFGIFAFMRAGIIFSYLFCLTSTLQGFVLFLYFVVFNEVSRKAWSGLLLCSRKQEKPHSKVGEMQSITVSSGIESGSGRR